MKKWIDNLKGLSMFKLKVMTEPMGYEEFSDLIDKMVEELK